MSGVLYGGDEVGAVVLDIGGTEVHAGYAGEDVPSCIFPSTVGFLAANDDGAMDTDDGSPKAAGRYIIGNAKTNLPIPHMEMMNPLQDGIVADWDLYEKEIDHAFEQLYATPSEHPVMFNDEAWSSQAQRQKITEIMFEKYQVPAYYLTRKPVMSAFANGKPTALIFDVSQQGCSVSPVFEGYLVQRGVTRSKLGGQVVLDMYHEYLKDKNIELVPKYAIAKRGVKEDPKTKKWTHKLKKLNDITSSFYKYQCNKELQDLSDTVTQVPDQPFDESAIQHIPTVPYELSTGYQVNVDSIRFQAPEVLFNPSSYAAKAGRNIIDLTDPGYNRGAADLIMASVQECDVDIQTNLLSNVVVTGSSSLMQGFVERLTNDLQNSSSPNVKMRLLAGSPIERKYSSWIGGSILGCLGSFQQMWVSKQEYEESGKVCTVCMAIVEKKCA